ncbi:hypothetical protein KCMC57_up58790 [Kitasatospora sp. CMC57]|uniref:Uncharacterized protein n=1 Tax=Kitasatospora sp. CMC57 TaxID=3231513 RepID=A0AB33K2Q4_9ACTN
MVPSLPISRIRSRIVVYGLPTFQAGVALTPGPDLTSQNAAVPPVRRPTDLTKTEESSDART